jgi:hypothetical protein
MAIRGAVFTSPKTIKGHDSCHCVAVPERSGTTFEKPAHYEAWDAEYEAVTKTLRDADEPVNLTTVLREMRSA